MIEPTVEVLGTEHVERWTRVLDRLPEERRDVYFTPGYARLYEGQDRRVRCIALVRGDETLLHIFLERRLERIGSRMLDQPVVTAEGVYGYGGPIASTEDPAFLATAHAAIEARQRDAGVVSEFVRFHPLLGTERLALPSWRPVLERLTVAIPLDPGRSDGWRAQYSSIQRNRLRRAERAGVTVEPSGSPEDWSAFVELYLATMGRLGVPTFYHFPPAYFAGLRTGLNEHCRLFVARWQGRVVAAAVILAYGRLLHHHLSGSDREAQAVAPNNLLFDTVARWGAERGYTRFHLGGGRTPAPDDALLRFKARFARPACPFFIGRGIYDDAAHHALRDAWMAAHPDRAHLAERYFQVYSMEEPAAA